jgi:hypothetical protein
VIIDDYGALPNCRQAVEDSRMARAITEPIFGIDWTGVFWQKGHLDATPPRRIKVASAEEIQPIAGDARFDEQLYLAL